LLERYSSRGPDIFVGADSESASQRTSIEMIEATFQQVRGFSGKLDRKVDLVGNLRLSVLFRCSRTSVLMPDLNDKCEGGNNVE
jgi:hypothetical protein